MGATLNFQWSYIGQPFVWQLIGQSYIYKEKVDIDKKIKAIER